MKKLFLTFLLLTSCFFTLAFASVAQVSAAVQPDYLSLINGALLMATFFSSLLCPPLVPWFNKANSIKEELILLLKKLPINNRKIIKRAERELSEKALTELKKQLQPDNEK